jgi:uncharacterized delta-60 repeat protein
MKRILPLFLMPAIFAVQPVFSQSGTLDTTFGTNGVTATFFGGQPNVLWGMQLQADNKIVAVGDYASNSTGNKFTVARYLGDGTLDDTFGTDGLVVSLYGAKCGAKSVAIQEDGKIIVAGYTSDQDNNSGNVRQMLIRYTADGDIDTSFATDGVFTAVLDGDTANVVRLQSDGKILVGAGNSTGGNQFIFRLLENGTLDTTFGDAGYVVTGFSVEDIILANNGTIYAASYHAVSKIDTNGVIDTAFGNNGLAIVSPGVGDIRDYGGFAFFEDGSFLVSGGVRDTRYVAFLIKYNPDGTKDTDFGNNGVILNYPADGEQDFGENVFIKYDKIFWTSNIGPATNYDFNLRVLELDGTPNTSFGTNGSVRLPIGEGHDYLRAALFQPDGKIVMGGRTWLGGFTLIRLNTEESLGVNQPIFAENGFAVYPNPVNSASVLAVNLQNNDVLTIKLYDVRGMLVKTVAENQNFTSGQSQLPLSLNGLGQGIYFLTVANQQGKTNTIKIIN